MKWGILLAVILYEAIVIVGIGYYLSKKQGQSNDVDGQFLLSGRDLPVSVVATTMALTVLGTIHILGIFEMSWHVGAISMWVSFAHVILLIVVCLATGKWARKIGVSTIPQLISMMYGSTARLLVSCVMAAVIFGILTLECQGLGIILNSITGWSVSMGAIVGAVFGVLYVIMAGMKEIGWVNLINTVVMYTGLVVTVIVLSMNLPLGWNGVTEYYVAQKSEWMLSVWGTPELLAGFALAFVFSTTFCQGCSQMLLQPALSAKNDQVVKKALWIAAPLNGLFGVFTVCIGLAAKSLPESHQLGGGDPGLMAKLAAPAMLVNYLPDWLVVWLLASFLAAVLSTFAMTVMTPATIFTIDIYKNLYNPNLDEKGEAKIARITILVLAVAALIMSQAMPQLVNAINWLFAWLVPVFILIMIGMFWKRSDTAAIATLALSWIVNCIWSFTALPKILAVTNVGWVNGAIMNNVYICIIISLLAGIILHLMLPGKPGFLTQEGEKAGLPAIA